MLIPLTTTNSSSSRTFPKGARRGHAGLINRFMPLSGAEPPALQCNPKFHREGGTHPDSQLQTATQLLRAQGEQTRFCQFVPSVRLVELIQAVGSAARLCKDHSQHLFTLDCSLPLCTLPSRRGRGGARRQGAERACVRREIPHRVNLDQIENRKPQANTRGLCENR